MASFKSRGVTELTQAKLSVAMVQSVSRMNAIADDRATIRQFCERSLQMRQQDDMVGVASIVDVWEACQTRMSIRHKAEAEAKRGGHAAGGEQGGGAGLDRQVRDGAGLQDGGQGHAGDHDSGAGVRPV